MRSSLAILALVPVGLALLFIGTASAGADTVYQTPDWTVNNPYYPGAETIPLIWYGAGATHDQPSPGTEMGNEVTLAGTNRNISNVTVTFGNYHHDPGTFTFTCDLYAANGAGGGPGTLLGSSTIQNTWNTGDSKRFNNSFPFANVTVPDTFIYVLSTGAPQLQGNYFGLVPSNTAAQAPLDVYLPELVGSGLNTIWSNTDTGWVANSDWAPYDGGYSQMTNLFAATITADATPVPEPITMSLLGMGIFGLGGYIRRRVKVAK